MNLFCPSCEAAFAGASLCPRCGGRLITPGEAFGLAADTSSDHPKPIPSIPLIRVLIGVVVGGGVFFALREWVYIGLFFAEQPETWWREPNGKLANAVLAVMAAIVGGLLAGAGQLIGTITGGCVGIAASALLFAITTGPGRPPGTETQLGILFAMLGSVAAGWIGSRIWPSVIVLPSADAGSRGSSVGAMSRAAAAIPDDDGRPTSWIKIIIAATLTVVVIAQADAIRGLIRDYSGGKLNVGGPASAPLVSLEIAAFLGLIVAGIAGMGTGSGFRHGLICGVITAIGVVAFSFRSGIPVAIEGLLQQFDLPPNLRVGQSLLAVMGSIIALGTVAGWFAGILLPPVVPHVATRRLPPTN